MAQTEKPTTLGYQETARRMATAGDGSGSCYKKIVGLTGACTAAEASTFANPGGATKLAANGFAIVDATTVAYAATNKVKVDHVFTCADAAQSVTGFAIENADAYVVFMECCFAAAIPAEVGDTITISATVEYKLGA